MYMHIIYLHNVSVRFGHLVHFHFEFRVELFRGRNYPAPARGGGILEEILTEGSRDRRTFEAETSPMLGFTSTWINGGTPMAGWFLLGKIPI